MSGGETAMKFVIRFTVLLASLALCACGGGSDDPAPSGGGGNTTPPPPPPPPAVTAPAITAQPVDAAADEGATATFTVVASGDGLTYQWSRNGNVIDGATDASYTTAALTMDDDQSTYSVTVTNAGGSVTSNNANLTVTATAPPPPPSGDDSLQPLAGPAEPFVHTAAPLSAAPMIGAVSGDHRYLLSWDPTSQGIYTFGFFHSNGAQSRLQIPVGAFLDEIMVTTAEVTDIGPSVTQVVAALDIEPGELIAEKPITATFTIPDDMMASIDPTQLIGFAADSDGSNLHMVPLVVGNLGATVSHPAVRLDHLGIAGIAVATPEQQAALAAAWPSDPGDQLAAALAPSLTANWRIAVGASAPTARVATPTLLKTVAGASDEDFSVGVLRGFYNDAVVPAFAAADADPTAIPAAIATGFQFLRFAALSGQSEDGGAFAVVAQQVQSRIHALLNTYADYIADRCRTLGGPPQLQQMLGVMRQLQLLGNDDKARELDGILPQCSTFKIALRLDYTRNAHWVSPYVAGDTSGTDTFDETGHAVVEGETTFGFNTPATDADLRLTTLDWTTTRTRDAGGVSTETWVNENVTVPWRVAGLSIPVIRTRSGTASSAITMYLSAFLDNGPNSDLVWHPFTATVMGHAILADGSEGTPIVSPFTRVDLPIFVPALPSDGQHNYGPMLLPQSGNASSQSTRSTPYHGGSIDENESVTLTISRPD
jgi:hypothetical protein